MAAKAENPPARILIVDDDPIVADSIAELLRREGHSVVTAGDGHEALGILREAAAEGHGAQPFNLVISDMNMPRVDGVELLKQIRRNHESVAVITITGYGSIERAVEVVRAGAFDYLTKPIIDEELKISVSKALRQQALMSENLSLKSKLAHRAGVDTMVGADHRMQRVYDLIDAVAPTKTTVLISGESGTGKSMVARAIHDRSPRVKKPFVVFACGSIPETLLESELFGHVKGAFTGADADKPGKLRAAEGGTLFIDEINSAAPTLQLKLLRVLQEKQFEPVGSHQTVSVDVRFVLAANEALDRMVKQGRFREDLYYRINVVNVGMPTLRERTGDIPMLLQHFLHKFCRETGKVITGIADDARDLLVRYRWPGNVRELENAIERCVVLARRPVVQVEDLPDAIRYQTAEGDPGFVERRKNPGGIAQIWSGQPLEKALEEPEKQILLAALKANNWNRQKTAEVLDINRTTLYKKMKQYGLDEVAAT